MSAGSPPVPCVCNWFKKTPKLSKHDSPKPSDEVEPNPNKTYFFYHEPTLENFVESFIPADVIRKIICNPEIKLDGFFKIITITDDGEVVPGHIQNLSDLQAYNFHEAFYVYFLWEMKRLEDAKSSYVIPESVESIFDVKPKLDLMYPVYLFGGNKIRSTTIFMSFFADGIRIMELASTGSLLMVRNYCHKLKSPTLVFLHEVILTCWPVTEVFGTYPLKEAEKVVVWNARGVCRPSFLENLETLIKNHNPSVFIITKSRVSPDNMELLIRNLSEAYIFQIFGDPTFTGGVCYMWKRHTIGFMGIESGGPCYVGQAVFQGRKPPKKRKCLIVGDC